MCYFKFINKNFIKTLDTPFDSSICDVDFMFPYYKEIPFDKEDDRIVLICVDKETSTIRSYAINGDSIE